MGVLFFFQGWFNKKKRKGKKKTKSLPSFLSLARALLLNHNALLFYFFIN